MSALPKRSSFPQVSPVADDPLLAALAGDSPDRRVKRGRNLCTIEQELRQSAGLGQPMASVRLRLTTACRGSRKLDGLQETAYLLRLEVLELSRSVRLEGFSLGPWSAENLKLEPGAIFLAEPLWTSFPPRTGILEGRLLLEEVEHNRLLDLPWPTEAVVPGSEPYTG